MKIAMPLLLAVLVGGAFGLAPASADERKQTPPSASPRLA